MPPLPSFSLPLSAAGPPPEYTWELHDTSTHSTDTTFTTAIKQRDTFLGENRCIVCGASTPQILNTCHIIPSCEDYTWENLRQKSWIHPQVRSVLEEPRNGISLCSDHATSFEEYYFFIRFVPDIRKFVFVNFSGSESLKVYHNKLVALDINDRHSPPPALFIIHEMRVRGSYPWAPTHPDTPEDPPWQDWIITDGVWDETTCMFKWEAPKRQPAPAQLQTLHLPNNAGGTSLGPVRQLGALNNDNIAELLAAGWASPSWKACQIEGTSWAGTAEENIETYAAQIGVSDDEEACSST